jgi:hypothetical protein
VNQKLTGNEHFQNGQNSTPAIVLDFWRWSASDLVSNASRGVLAEFIVATALDVAEGIRTEWDAFDLTANNGTKVEVKSAAYLQRWHQDSPSVIRFSIAPSSAWNAETNQTETDKKRQADVYVFCLLHHRDKETLDPLNLDQWTFYVLPTSELNAHCGDQKSIGRLRKFFSVNSDWFILRIWASRRIAC